MKDDQETKKLLKEINCKMDRLLNVNSNELESQMDSWLLTLKQAVGKLETVSDKVDSNKIVSI